MGMHKNSLVPEVIQIVKANPGIGRKDIFQRLDGKMSMNTLSVTLRRLREQQVIERRGGTSNRWNPGGWHFLELEVEDRFAAIAQSLLQDIQEIHEIQRETWLASRLQEIFDEGES